MKSHKLLIGVKSAIENSHDVFDFSNKYGIKTDRLRTDRKSLLIRSSDGKFRITDIKFSKEFQENEEVETIFEIDFTRGQFILTDLSKKPLKMWQVFHPKKSHFSTSTSITLNDKIRIGQNILIIRKVCFLPS